MKIAIISDTHSLLRPEVTDTIKRCDILLHAGDIANEETYNRISKMIPSHFVRGNADKEWAGNVPKELRLEIAGYRFFMIHNKKDAGSISGDIDFFIYGHSHKYENRQEGDTIFLNPGSCGPRRFTQPITMMIMELEEERGGWKIEKLDFSPVLKEKNRNLPHKEMDQLVKHIVKDMDAKKTVEQIAKRNRVEKELVERILQVYTTHPGIDTDGILNRIDC